MIEILFAFVIETGGFKEFCDKNPCPLPEHVTVAPEDRTNNQKARGIGGQYAGDGVIRMYQRAGTIGWEVATVHEMTHYLQGLTGILKGYAASPCVRWKTEQHAYAVGEAWAKRKGYTTLRVGYSHGSTVQDQATCELGVEKGLFKDIKYEVKQ